LIANKKDILKELTDEEWFKLDFLIDGINLDDEVKQEKVDEEAEI